MIIRASISISFCLFMQDMRTYKNRTAKKNKNTSILMKNIRVFYYSNKIYLRFFCYLNLKGYDNL